MEIKKNTAEHSGSNRVDQSLLYICILIRDQDEHCRPMLQCEYLQSPREEKVYQNAKFNAKVWQINSGPQA